MTRKSWTLKEIDYLKRNALLDTTNAVVNVNQLAKHLGRSHSAIAKRISTMRKEGLLPKVERENSIDTVGQPFSQHAIKRIEAMLKNGSTAKEIAESLGRTESSIYNAISRLRRKGIIKTTSKRGWEVQEEAYLIAHIQFDEHGYTANTQELAKALNRPYQSVSRKISHLRKKGSIAVKADLSKTSTKAKQAHDEFNQMRFAQYGKEVSKVVNTPSKAEVVQVVRVVVSSSNGEEIHQYWTFDGKLLAENKNSHLVK